MSRIGKKPIQIPPGVTVSKNGNVVVVRGPKGELSRPLVAEVELTIGPHEAVVAIVKHNKRSPALWGLYRALIQNMVDGVTKGFEKKLEIEGVGFKVQQDGAGLVFSLGLSHPVKFSAPVGVQLKAEKNVITVSGSDTEAVGDTAARIQKLKPPEPYKGKGIRYEGEIIRRKAGKKAIASAA